VPSTSKELLGGQDAVAEVPDPFGVIAHPVILRRPSAFPLERDERHAPNVPQTTDRVPRARYVRREADAHGKDEPMSTSSETLRPGISWNATRAASLLMVVIIAVIALVFWPSFSSVRPEPSVPQGATGIAAPHEQIVIDDTVCAQCQP
jgi:hypothetical protein